MARETWKVGTFDLTNGIDLNVEYRDGLYATPNPRGANLIMPLVSGERWRPKQHGPGSFVLKLWWGDGVTQDAAFKQYEQILRACARPHVLTRYVRTLADGTSRYADGELTAAVQPTALGQGGYRATLEVSVPDSYWFSTTDMAQEFTAPNTAGGSAVALQAALTDFERSTAPLERLTYFVDGGINTPRLIALTDDIQRGTFQYAGSILSGQRLIVDSDTWGVSGDGSGTISINQGAVSYTDGRLLSIPPALPGEDPKVLLVGTYLAGTVRLTVQGRLAFQC